MLYDHAARLARKTHRYYHCQLTPFLGWRHLHENQSVSSITPSLIRRYLVNLQERDLSDFSIHAAARAIRAFLNFCVREGIIAVSPMAKVAMPRVPQRVLPAFTNDEVYRIVQSCDSLRDETIVLTLLDTGCRAAELVNLDAKDVDLHSGEVLVRSGKGRKDRSVFLGVHSRARLVVYYGEIGTADAGDPVWLSQTRGERLTPSGLHQLLKRLGARAGVQHCAPHTFRRTFAVSCLRNGMDLFRLARLMGHADINVLRQYHMR